MAGAETAAAKRRLWERLNPLSRKQIRVIAEALALQQNSCTTAGTAAGTPQRGDKGEIERLAARTRALLAEVARRTPRAREGCRPDWGADTLLWLSPKSAAPYFWRHLPWQCAQPRSRRGRMRFASKAAENCTA